MHTIYPYSEFRVKYYGHFTESCLGCAILQAKCRFGDSPNAFGDPQLCLPNGLENSYKFSC